MTCHAIKKAAADRDVYTLHYDDWLEPGDTIVAADTPVVADIDADPVIDAGRVLVWLSGGQPGVSYQVKVKVTTAKGRVKTECVRVRVR